MSDTDFLATVWDQGMSINVVGDSGAFGRCVAALTDWWDILPESTTSHQILQNLSYSIKYSQSYLHMLLQKKLDLQ